MPSNEAALDRALRAIADPTRRRILQELKDYTRQAKGNRSTENGASLCAGDLEERVKLSQSTISHHMSILVKAELVEASKRGQWRWYRRNEKAIRKLTKALKSKL